MLIPLNLHEEVALTIKLNKITSASISHTITASHKGPHPVSMHEVPNLFPPLRHPTC